MTQEEVNYIKDAFSQIIDDIAGNPDWDEAARAVASDLGTLERKLEEKISSFPSGLDEAAVQAAQVDMCDRQIMEDSNKHRMLYSRIFRRGFKAGVEWRDALISKLPDNLDEAALKAYPKMSRVSEPHGIIPADNKSHLLGDGNSEKREGFITGAMFELGKIKIAANKAVENQDTAEKFLKSVGIMDENGNLSETYK